MLSRRHLLVLGAEASAAMVLAGCAISPPLKKDVFPEYGDSERPYLGLATTLREEYSYRAEVEGEIPEQVRGALYRNGPALFDRGGLRKRNLLDGDGMVQSFTFRDDGVWYRNRFVRTRKFMDEEAAGRFLYPSWSTQAPGGFWGNFLRMNFLGQAGITVFPWRGRLYAFDECALPYEMDPLTLDTYGISRLGLPDGFTIYAAHAKFDPVSGDWLHFGILFGPTPKLHITIFAPDGSLRAHRSLPMPRKVYLHDWFVSRRYLMLSLHPVEMDFLAVLLGRKSMVESLSWHPEKGNLLLLFDRSLQGEPILMEADASYMWHSANAFEQGGELVADFIGYRNPDHFVGRDPVASAVMQGRAGEHAYPGTLRRYRIDPAKRKVTQEVLEQGGNYEWPRVNEQRRGLPHRFAYFIDARPGEFFWTKVCRYDLASGRVDRYDFGPGSFLTEPVFVPLPERRYPQEDHDEPGFLLTEVYDSKSKLSYLAILRADRLVDGPVAIVHLRHHVPFSYHGWWSAGTGGGATSS